MPQNIRIHESPEGLESSGACFCLFSLFAEVEQIELYFHYFSINIDCLFALTG